jgi:hypothetical protein
LGAVETFKKGLDVREMVLVALKVVERGLGKCGTGNN